MNYEDLHISAEARNTMINLDESRRMDLTVDPIFLSETHQQMQVKTTSVAAASVAVGLSIHEGINEFLKHTTENTNSVTHDGKALTYVESFTYLINSIIDEGGRSDAGVKTRIGKSMANGAWRTAD